MENQHLEMSNMEAQTVGNVNHTSMHSTDTVTCMEKTMTFMIRLRIKLEKAQAKGLIGYNCTPLLKLFEQCEFLYENTGQSS